MAKRSLICAVAFLCFVPFARAGQADMTNSGPWSGVIMNSGCTADEAYAEAAKCTENVPGAKLMLFDDTSKKVYELEPQAKAAGHFLDGVTVHGALDGNLIHVSSLEVLNSIGLPVGQKAPDFTAQDQFGRERTLQSLQGPHGTVLLIFRSADW